MYLNGGVKSKKDKGRKVTAIKNDQAAESLQR